MKTSLFLDITIIYFINQKWAITQLATTRAAQPTAATTTDTAQTTHPHPRLPTSATTTTAIILARTLTPATTTITMALTMQPVLLLVWGRLLVLLSVVLLGS